MAFRIDALPEELVLRVFNNLERLDDFYSVMLTCKQFQRIALDVKAEKISQLALHSGNYFPALRPLSHFLLFASARRLSEWAREDEGRQAQLKTTMHGGVDELAALAMEVAPISLEDIRATWAWKRDIVVPLSKRLDFSCGPLSRSVDEAYLTVCEDVDLALFAWAIYGELFDHVLHPTRLDNVRLDSITRFKFLIYCVPDVNSFHYMSLESPQWFNNMGDVKGERFQQLSLYQAIDDELNRSGFAAAIGQLTNLVSPSTVADPRQHNKASRFVQIVMNSGQKSLEVLQTAYLARLGHQNSSANTITWLRDLWALVDEAMGPDADMLPPTGDNWVNDHLPSMGHDLMFTLWNNVQYNLRTGGSKTEEELREALRTALAS